MTCFSRSLLSRRASDSCRGLRQPLDAEPLKLGRVLEGGVAGHLRGQREPLVHRGQADGQHRTDQQVGVGAAVEALHLDVGRPVGLADRPGDEPQRGLPVLPAPAAVHAGPVRGHLPEVAGDARRADGTQRGQGVEQAGQDRLTLVGHAVRAATVVEQVDAVAVQREVQVLAVADPAGHHGGSERGGQAVPSGDRPDRLPQQQDLVGGRDRVQRRRRELELPGGVLRVQLEHLDRLGVQGGQQVVAVVGQLDHPGHPVRRPAARRTELLALIGAERPLDLEAHPYVETGLGRARRHPPSEAALAARVLIAVLGVPVHRSPGPAGLARQGDDPVEVGMQPQVASRAAGEPPGGDAVVDAEHVEHRRHPDPPAGRVGEPVDRHGLHPCDTGVVDVREGDPVHTVPGQDVGERASPTLLVLAPLCVHGSVSPSTRVQARTGARAPAMERDRLGG